MDVDGGTKRTVKRVDQLARDMGVEPVALLAWLQAHGESMKRLGSIVDYRAEDRARSAVAGGEIPVVAASAHHPYSGSRTLPPQRSARRPAKKAPREAARSRLVTYIVERSYSDRASGFVGIDIATAAQYEQQWLRNLFDADEAIEWLEAGALPSEAPSAASLRRVGVSPDAAGRDIPCGAGGCRLRHSAIGRVSRGEVTADEAVIELRALGVVTGVRAESCAQEGPRSVPPSVSNPGDGADGRSAPMLLFSHSEDNGYSDAGGDSTTSRSDM